jgi:toxin ParE1/3/4
MSSAKNTAFRVELTSNASLDLEAIYGSIDAENSSAAARWFNGLEEAVFSLDHLPDRGVRTPEDRKLRQRLYGNKPHIYRIIYSVNDAEMRVLVLHIRHGARRAFEQSDVLGS